MKLTTILILGAATLATPAASDANASADNTSNGQVAMNNSASDKTASDNSTAAAAVSSVPDTEKTYKDSSRASDFRKEAETTKELNQQMASANGIPKTQE